jgi:fatty acid desaturase
MAAGAPRGEEFRDDLRRPGHANAQARRLLAPQELEPLTRLSALRAVLSIAQTLALAAGGIALALLTWPSGWLLPALLMIGVAQHGLFILAHEAAHYRLFGHRGANDAAGRLLGALGGVSMCTYRVTHRLHHNNLYTEEDPDTAIHGGYPRGRGYLCKKLAQDLAGWNAWKTYAYFFGAPAINDDTRRAIRPLDDTSAELRAAARADRWWVVALHVAMPLAAWAAAGLQGLLLYGALWLLPLVTVLQPILRLRAILEHGAVDDLGSPLTAARTNRTWGSLPNWLARAFLFPHHVNYHLEHHLYPAVPHYNLPRLHRILLDKQALDAAEVRDVSWTLGRVFAPRREAARRQA